MSDELDPAPNSRVWARPGPPVTYLPSSLPGWTGSSRPCTLSARSLRRTGSRRGHGVRRGRLGRTSTEIKFP